MFIALATHVLPQLQPYTQAMQSQLLSMAMERDDALNSENPLVIQFWDVYDRLSHRNSQMAKDEARHGCGFKGLFDRYFGE